MHSEFYKSYKTDKMKKIYLSICVAILTTSVFAQMDNEKNNVMNTILITNLLGEEIFFTNTFINGTYKKDIDLSVLGKGIYLLKIGSSNSSAAKRIVIK